MLEGEFLNSTISEASSLRSLTRTRRFQALITSWAQKAQKLQKEAHVFYFAFKHPRTPWYAKLIAACAAFYLLSPIQIIPSFVPVIGFMDDLVVLVLGFKLIRKTISPDVLKECRERAEAAEVIRKANSSITEAVVSITVATLWLISGIVGSLLIASYLRRR